MGMKKYMVVEVLFLLVVLFAALFQSYAVAIYGLLGFVSVMFYIMAVGMSDLLKRIKRLEEKVGVEKDGL